MLKNLSLTIQPDYSCLEKSVDKRVVFKVASATVNRIAILPSIIGMLEVSKRPAPHSLLIDGYVTFKAFYL